MSMSSLATKVIIPRSRPLPARKQVLFTSHRQLLVSNDLILFLRPGDFSAQEWRQLRAAISQISSPPQSPITPETTTTTVTTNSASGLKLTVLRPGLLPALLRDTSTTSQINTNYLETQSHLQGPLAVLTASTLHPPTLSRVLTILRQFSRNPSPNAPPPDPKAKTKAPPVERMAVLSSLLERTRVADEQTTRDVIAKLPTLDILRSQIVGLLSTPGSRITGVIGARASQVGRTLEGFKQGLQASEPTATSGGDTQASTSSSSTP